MLLSRSLRRKVLASILGSLVLVLLYDATVIDSRSVPGGRFTSSATGARMPFVATAYCKGETTASGAPAKSGVAAADPRWLPLGSVIQLDDGVPEKHQGIYTILDTGPKIQGSRLDLYMWSCYDALDFGKRTVSVRVLRFGWKPNESSQLKTSGRAPAPARP